MVPPWKAIFMCGALFWIRQMAFLVAPALVSSPGKALPTAQNPDASIFAQTFDLPEELGRSRRLPAGVHHIYRIGLKPGQLLSSVVQQEGVDVHLAVLDPLKKVVFKADTPNGVTRIRSSGMLRYRDVKPR